MLTLSQLPLHLRRNLRNQRRSLQHLLHGPLHRNHALSNPCPTRLPQDPPSTQKRRRRRIRKTDPPGIEVILRHGGCTRTTHWPFLDGLDRLREYYRFAHLIAFLTYKLEFHLNMVAPRGISPRWIQQHLHLHVCLHVHH